MATADLAVDEFADALISGLTTPPRRISPKWFYDSRGSALFDRICELPEYYPTRVEMELLQRHAQEIARLVGPDAEVVEFGAGALRKAGLVLEALDRPAAYRPIDIAGDFLLEAAGSFRCAFPGLPVHPLVADFTHAIRLPAYAGTRLGLYLGSSIGNFDPVEATTLLRRMRTALAGGSLLIGVDLIKDPAVLHAAYNDAAGITAQFNLNLWARANREADADFDLRQWAHAAFYNAPERRIEMHLLSRRKQRVEIAGRRIDFDEGDSVHTECSYKYTVESFQKLARHAGWTPRAVRIDEQRQFSLHWLN